MPLFGWDASHYDGRLSTTILARAKAEGISFFHHKIAEGLSDTEGTYDDTALAAARDAGIEFVGGYGVVRSEEVAAEVAYLVRSADAGEPWWRAFHGWYWVADLERWKYDNVQPAIGVEFCQRLRDATGRQVFLYASHGQYGDQLAGWDGPLINADYVSTPAAGFAAMYPGDDWQPLHGTWRGGWAPYSGQKPAVLQYTSSAIVAGLTTCDVNAYPGTVAQFRALIEGGADDMRTVLVMVRGGDGRVWLSNGLTRYHVGDHTSTDHVTGGPAVLTDVIGGANTLLGTLVDTTVHQVDDLDAFGAEIPADLVARLDALAAKVATVQAAGTWTQEQVNAAFLAAMLDPRVQKGIGDSIAQHLHVT